MRTVSPPRTYTLDSLAAEAGLSKWTIRGWIKQGLVPEAHGPGGCHRYYDDAHLRAINTVRKVRDDTPILRELGQHLREEGITLVQYLAQRDRDALRA